MATTDEQIVHESRRHVKAAAKVESVSEFAQIGYVELLLLLGLLLALLLSGAPAW